MKIYLVSVLSIVFLVCSACSTPKSYSEATVSNKYAKGFTISEGNNFTKIIVYNPWQTGSILATYYLVKSSTTKTPNDGIRIQVPVQRLTVTSCTHIGFLKAINQLDCVCGICSPEIVYNREVFHPKDGHEVMNVGDAMTPDVERIVRTNPDAVMVSTYAQGDAATEKLRSLGVPVIYNNEWTENDPLARAEWLRFIGCFFDCLPFADSIFNEISSSYETLKQQTVNIHKKRSIMSGNNFRGTWYMPAGSTYMGVLFHDAGAEYYYENDTSHFSIPLNIETVIHRFSDADVWVGCPAESLDELAQMDEKHTWFQSFKNGEVYNFALRTTELGGNDFWETGVVHPEYILSDLIHILYPNLTTDTTFYFSKHLK